MPVGVDERAVDQRVAAVRVAHERQRQVRAVVEVDREPVPAAAADRDEVAPLVVEPGVAVDAQDVRSPRVSVPVAVIAVRE